MYDDERRWAKSYVFGSDMHEICINLQNRKAKLNLFIRALPQHRHAMRISYLSTSGIRVDLARNAQKTERCKGQSFGHRCRRLRKMSRSGTVAALRRAV
jgi:hypothetical protein